MYDQLAMLEFGKKLQAFDNTAEKSIESGEYVTRRCAVICLSIRMLADTEKVVNIAPWLIDAGCLGYNTT